MFLNLIVGIFTVANSFIALFILSYAFLFLAKTKSHKDRRPWDYLFLASIIYLIFTIFLMLIQIFDKTTVLSVSLGLTLYDLSVFFQFVYTGLILLAFISQTDLIFNNQVIIIMKKDSTAKDVPLVKVEVPSGQNVQVSTPAAAGEQAKAPEKPEAAVEQPKPLPKKKARPKKKPRKNK